jgi:DNA-directed RNA polymerase subunit RPC12/RpoP
MKITCAFCKTEFSAARGDARCPVCGHRAAAAKRGGETRRLWVAVAALLAASIFATVALGIFGRNQKRELLTVSISNVGYADSGYVVRGNIRNFSDGTYSIPDLVFLIKTDSGAVLSRIIHLPPSGLIEPMSDIEFVKKIGPRIKDAQKISVHFAEEEN